MSVRPEYAVVDVHTFPPQNSDAAGRVGNQREVNKVADDRNVKLMASPVEGELWHEDSCIW